MGSEWPTVRLGDAVELKRGYDLPKSLRREGSVPIVSSSGASGHHAEAKVEPPGVVTGRYGTIGQVFYVEEPFWPLNTTLYVCDFKGNDPRFVSYLLETVDYASCADKAAVPGVNRNHLHELKVQLPPLNEQRAIACILGALDDKIELNRRLSRTLDEMAQAVFKLSFGGVSSSEVPDGWSLGTLGDLVEQEKLLVDPQRHPEERFDHYSIPAFDNGQMPVEQTGAEIKSTKFGVAAGSVLLSKLNPGTPRVWWPSPASMRRSIASTEFLVLTPKSYVTREYVFGLVQSEPFVDAMRSMVTGTSGSHQRVKPETALALRVLIPPAHLVVEFSGAVSGLRARQAWMREESRTLSQLRSCMKSRLLSGQLRPLALGENWKR